MLKIISAFLLGSLVLASTGCRKDENKDLRSSMDGMPQTSMLPDDAVITKASLRKGDYWSGFSTYTFVPETLKLQGYFSRGPGYMVSGYAEAETDISDVEWALVLKNIQLLKPVDDANIKCGIAADGPEHTLTVTYKQKDVEHELSIATLESKMFRCADYYMADETFAEIFGIVQERLPAPTEDSAFTPWDK